MKEESFIRVLEIIFYASTMFILVLYLPLFVSIFALFPLAFKIWMKLGSGVCRSYRRLDGKIAIVTGSNVGIGLETAKDLARRGARVILACRSMDRGMKALEEIRQETEDSNVVLKQLDLSSLASVRKFAREFNAEESRLDILVNNAGTILNEKLVTGDRLETNIQSNHFGPFLLTNLLLDKMRKTGNARIVMVASVLHKLPRSLDLDNLNAEKSWEPYMAYCRTKLANLLFTKELHRRLRNAGITDLLVNAVHPGLVRTALMRDSAVVWYMRLLDSPVLTFFFKNALEGAQTSIHAAVSDDVDGVSGEYFEDCQKTSSSSLSNDSTLARQLWDRSAKAVGLKPDETFVY